MFTAILPTLNYAQPMNPLHPLNGRGLRTWWKSLPNISGGTIIPDLAGNRYPGTFAKPRWGASGPPFGPATALPIYYKSVTGVIVDTTFAAHSTQRTYACWTLRTGSGGIGGAAGIAYVLSKRNSFNTEIETLMIDSTAGGNKVSYARGWTTGATWTCPAPTLGAWGHIAVTYDAGATTNDPVMYVDGVSQTVTEASAPTGTLVTNTDFYHIGNSGGGSTPFEGPIDDFRIYDRILRPGEIYQLFMDSKAPYSPLYNWQESLMYGASQVLIPRLLARKRSITVRR